MFAFIYDYAMKHGIDRYMQDPELFEWHREEIKQLYQQDIPLKTDMVAIHVRRGDYVGNSFYVDLFAEGYYEKAMELFPGANFLVFSDDIEWCKKQPIFYMCEFSEGKSELEDMNLMASCIGHIVANSSFSWWGAFISPYSKKIVAPSRYNWYTDQEERTKCPDSWIRL